jgi:NAD(P)-dependent dehydrogenase (short-subunit alcohol dehydrogenase family)
MKTQDFEGKKVLVTGASRGIGRAVATAFADRGGTVAVNFNKNEKAAAGTLRSLGGEDHLLIRADVSTPEGARSAVDESISGLGGLDIVVNNAGIFKEHRIASVSFDEWQSAWKETIDVNLLGPANICYLAAQHMIGSGGGRIVNVSSRAAFRGEPNSPAYAASKAGVNIFSQSLAFTLAPHNIFVGVVAPGFVETDMATELLSGPDGDAIRAQSPLGRVARPEEVAHAVLFLASEGAEFSTGAIIDVNGASYLRS